jgi:hypothetical protein
MLKRSAEKSKRLAAKQQRRKETRIHTAQKIDLKERMTIFLNGRLKNAFIDSSIIGATVLY